MNDFKFEVGQEVTIDVSGEHGSVIGRAEYAASCNQYFIHYQAADGRAVSDWFDEQLLA